MIWNIRTTLSSVPGGPLVSSGFPLSLLLLAALVLVLSFLFCGLFLRLALQYLVRKRDEVSGCDEGGGGGDTETLEDTVVTPSAPPLLTSDSSSCAPLPPPPTYSEAVASSPPPKLGSQHPAHPHVQPPPYSLLIGPSGPCLARSYTANTSWHRIAWQDTSRCWRKGKLHISFFHHSNLKSLGFPSKPDQPKSAKKTSFSKPRLLSAHVSIYGPIIDYPVQMIT